MAPPVSVVVVSHGRPAALARCLRGIAQLDYAPFEVVVVACPAGVAAARALPFADALKLQRFETRNISAARNAGIAQAAGAVVAFIDDDAVPEPLWLAHLGGAMDGADAVLAGGTVLGRNGISVQWGARAADGQGRHVALDHPGDAAGPPAVPPGHAFKAEGTNMAVRRDALARLGGFDPAFRYFLDETDLCLRLAGAGGGAVFVPRAQVHHGFAASPVRRADRTPRDLSEIGASMAAYLLRHCPEPARQAAWNRFEAEQRARVLRAMQRGPLAPDDVARLMRGLRAGRRDGIASLFVLHPSTLYHRVTFSDDGVWVQCRRHLRAQRPQCAIGAGDTPQRPGRAGGTARGGRAGRLRRSDCTKIDAFLCTRRILGLDGWSYRGVSVRTPQTTQRQRGSVMSKKVTKAIFPVAGLGTRFLPATKSVPKEIMTLVDRPLIQYAIDEARAAGITEFIFVTSRGKSALEDYFDHAPQLEEELRRKGKDALLETLKATNMDSGDIVYIRQHKALGLGHAIWCARNLIHDEPFAVILPDDVIVSDKPCLQQMVEAYEQTGGNMVAAIEVPRERTSSYGILDVEKEDGALTTVKGMVEKPKAEDAPSNLAVIGRYILSPKVFQHLDQQETGAGGEIQLTDAIAREIGGEGVFGYRFNGQRFDCGSKSGFLQATVAFGLAREDLRDDLEAYLDELMAVRKAAQ